MTQAGPDTQSALRAVLEALPSATFIITSAFDGKRAGVRVRAAMPCAAEPLLIAVAARKGHWIEPMIRDAHAFALCQLDPADRLLLAKFDEDLTSEDDANPFDALPYTTLRDAGPPIPRKSILAIDCEVVRHFDLEADHELYIGQVLAARLMRQDA